MRIVDYLLGLAALAGAMAVGLLLAAAAAVAIGIVSLRPSQPPLPSPWIARQQEQDLAANNPRNGTADDGIAQPISAAPDDQDHSDQHERPHSDKRADGEAMSAIPDPPKLTDWIMVGLTGALIAVTAVQAVILVRQISDARTRQRAWVVIEAMDGHLKTDLPLPSSMTVFNSGETPAFIYRRIIEAVVLARDTVDLSADILAVTAKLDATDDISMVLAPHGQKHTFNRTHIDLVLNEEVRGEIAHDGGTDTIFLIGMIRYRDTFKADQMSVCCYRWNGEKKKWMGHSRHNKMT